MGDSECPLYWKDTGNNMNKMKEKEIQALEIFCIITSLLTVVLGVMFLFDFWQSYWFLNVILGLGVLLHLALVLLFLVGHKTVQTITSGLFMLFYAGVFVYINFL